MNYQICYEPIAHVIFYNIFSKEERKIIMNTLNALSVYMAPGEVFMNKENKIVKNMKDNLNFWPYNRTDLSESNLIIDIIERKVWAQEIRKIYLEVKDSMFSFFHYSNESHIMISRYEKNSYYDWHRDLQRSLTLNIWLSDDDVVGGNFEIQNLLGDIKSINYDDNMMIAFPSECHHRVTRIENDSTRYSIQYFSTYNQYKE